MCPIMIAIFQQNLIILKGATTNGKKKVNYILHRVIKIVYFFL